MNNNQAGKGSKLRKGANLKKYRDAEYWIELEKRKEEKKNVYISLPDDRKNI